MGIQASSGSALASGHTRSAVTRLSGAGQDLSTGNQSKDSSKLALAASLAKTLAESGAYLNNVGVASANVVVAKGALDNIKAQVLEMKSLAVQAQSASGSQLATLNTLYGQKKTLVADIVQNAAFNGDTFFAASTAGQTFQVSSTITISADMDSSGGALLSDVGANGGTALATNTQVGTPATIASLMTIAVSGQVLVTGANGGAAGTLGNGSLVSVLSGQATVTVGGNSYTFAEGDAFLFNLANASVLTYSGGTDLSNASTIGVVLTGGSFTGTSATAGALDLAITNRGAALIAASPFNGSAIDTIGNATTAIGNIDTVLDYISQIETKLIAMESSLSGFGGALEAEITSLADAEESLRSVDITDFMADIVAASGQAKSAMYVWQANLKQSKTK